MVFVSASIPFMVLGLRRAENDMSKETSKTSLVHTAASLGLAQDRIAASESPAWDAHIPMGLVGQSYCSEPLVGSCLCLWWSSGTF